MTKKNIEKEITINELTAIDLWAYYSMSKEMVDTYNNHCIANEDDPKAYSESLTEYNKYFVVKFKLKEEISRRLKSLC